MSHPVFRGPMAAARVALRRRAVAALAVVVGAWSVATGAAEWAVERLPGRLAISRAGHPVAEYVFADREMKRPGIANVRSPRGLGVTRPRPPRPGIDADDHASMHPGIWLAFGDVSGEDFWRNKAAIEHLGWVGDPEATDGGVRFTARSRLVSASGTPLGWMTDRVVFADVPAGRVVAWLSVLEAGAAPLVLGDQEEMGFGVRLATPLAEKSGGRMLNSAGATTAAEAWGRGAEWCDGAGECDGVRVGLTVVADPDNFRPCWWHTRDYGLVVANPFGRAALAGGEASRVTVEPGESLRLGFAAVIREETGAAAPADPAAAAAAGLAVLRSEAEWGRDGATPR